MKRGYHPPLTVTRRALLKGGSDVEFRRLIYRLLLVEERLRRARDFLGKRAGLTGPQYTMLITVAYLVFYPRKPRVIQPAGRSVTGPAPSP